MVTEVATAAAVAGTELSAGQLKIWMAPADCRSAGVNVNHCVTRTGRRPQPKWQM